MKKAIVTVGVSASGKSTFAKDWVTEGGRTPLGEKFVQRRGEINRDSIRVKLMELDGKQFSWDKWNWKREKDVTVICDDMITDRAKHGHDIIISDTNLNGARREHLVAKLVGLGYDVEIKDFPITWEEAVKRDNARMNGVGQSVLATQFEQWNAYIGRKTYTPDTSKPKCILVDIDGTLAHMNGKRGAFDWDKVGLDDCDEMVIDIVNSWANNSPSFGNDVREVIVLSGRDGICKPETTQWLYDNKVLYDKLIMRAPNDMRKDTIVKEEIFWRDVADNYNVQFVIDDRPSVCRMWRELGLKVFQVGDPAIEF